jgi:hypothetical protein
MGYKKKKVDIIKIRALLIIVPPIFFQVSHFLLLEVCSVLSSLILSMWLSIAFYMLAPLLRQLHQVAVSLRTACVHNMM